MAQWGYRRPNPKLRLGRHMESLFGMEFCQGGLSRNVGSSLMLRVRSGLRNKAHLHSIDLCEPGNEGESVLDDVVVARFRKETS